ncbi:MAG: signal peptide peptidase SppA [Sulfurospirillum sp.]|nr:signal peptide peptidase SppA [Sulfurospirillum sp.]
MIIFRWIGKMISYINNHFKTVVFLFLIFLIFNPFSKESLQEPNLATIRLDGIIINIDKILLEINSAALNSNIKGVLLQVDSPGGALAPSIELSMAIKRLNKIKPVIAYASGSMTSGSYYASIWTKKIIANPGAFIGSIGVLFQAPNIKKLADKLGISEQIIIAGEYKQMGTLTREWTIKEREALQELISDAYELFITDVSNARGLKKEDAKEFANARVFIAKKAKLKGLIDEVGSLHAAKLELEKISGVKNPIWTQPSEFDNFLKELKASTFFPIANFSSYLR